MNKNVLYYCKVGSYERKTLPGFTNIQETCLENDYQYEEVVRQINQMQDDFEMFINEYEWFKKSKKTKKIKSSKAKKIIKRR